MGMREAPRTTVANRAGWATPWIDTRWAIAAVVLGAASAVLGVLASGHDTFPGDAAVNATVRGLGSAFEPVAYTFNELEAQISIAVIGFLAVMLVARHQYRALALIATVMVLRPVLNVPKALVGRPRPSGDFPIRDVVTDSSFPSGHTMTAVMVFSMLFVFAPLVMPRRAVALVRVASVACMALTAVSRMWAGVHWFSDTWGGVIWALAAVSAAFALQPSFEALGRRLRRQRGRAAARGPSSAE